MVKWISEKTKQDYYMLFFFKFQKILENIFEMLVICLHVQNPFCLHFKMGNHVSS